MVFSSPDLEINLPRLATAFQFSAKLATDAALLPPGISQSFRNRRRPHYLTVNLTAGARPADIPRLTRGTASMNNPAKDALELKARSAPSSSASHQHDFACHAPLAEQLVGGACFGKRKSPRD